MTDVTGEPWEFVADGIPADAPVPRRDMQDPLAAASALEIYMKARAEAVLSAQPGDPVLLLSGGVDSIATGATLHSLGVQPYCVTVIGRDEAQTDRSRAEEAAAHFGFEHHVVELDSGYLIELVSEIVKRLEMDELWEVAAAVPITAAFAHIDHVGIDKGPVFAGAGADVLLAGGKRIHSDLDGDTAREELEELIWADLHSHFIYERQIPDFYRRVLGDQEGRFVQFFQTEAAWELTNRFGPMSLFRPSPNSDTIFDKVALREAAVSLGVPADLAWTRKEPLQVSSGIIGGLEFLAREITLGFPGASTYSNPLTEPAGQVLARWAIRSITAPTSPPK